MLLFQIGQRLTVVKFVARTKIKLTVDIKLGPVSPTQTTAWHRLWQCLIAEAKREVRDDKQL